MFDSNEDLMDDGWRRRRSNNEKRRRSWLKEKNQSMNGKYSLTEGRERGSLGGLVGGGGGGGGGSSVFFLRRHTHTIMQP